MILHDFPLSGHAHRARLMLALLDLPVTLRAVDLPNRAQKAPAFLALNAFGQVPVLEDGELCIADSNAILVYLATRYDPGGSWYPADPVLRAEIQRWLSVAAGPLANGPAAARIATLFGAPFDIAAAQAGAAELFRVVEAHLEGRDWLVGGTPTLADIALYSYTAHAPEGGIALDPWPLIRGWLARIEALPGFVPMPRPLA